jgi:phage shock protein A
MKLFKAIFSRLRGADRDAAKSITDTKVEAENAIEDSAKSVLKFKVTTRDALASNKLLIKQKEEADSDVAKFLGFATKAANAGDEANAKKALTKKASAEKKARSLGIQIDSNEVVIRKCRDQIEAIENKLDSARSNVDSLVARDQSAKLQQSLTDGFDGDSALSKLDDLEDAVEAQEAKAEAGAEMAETSGSQLEDLYGADTSVDDELAALMNKGK